MRDGAVLRADVYRPPRDEPHPAVLNRTPYDRSLSLTPPAALDPESAVAAGLALVCQDVRGQYSSEGEFYPFRSEEADGFDSVEWVAAQRWCNGKVAMAGRSYSGATQWLAAAARPPHLEAIFPVVAGSDYYNGWIYQGGAFQLGFNLFWVQLMTAPKERGSLTEQYRHLPLTDPPLLEAGPAGRFYRDWLAHPDDDGYWQALAINRRYDRIEVPAYIVGGWYDLFLSGTLENYCRMRSEAATERARSHTRLLVGPWAHGSTYGAYPEHAFPVFGEEASIDLAQLQTAFYHEQLFGPTEEPATACADLRHGREPLARRARLASRSCPRAALVSTGRRRTLDRSAGCRAARRLPLRPERPGADDRRADLAARAVPAHELRPARSATARGAAGRARLQLGAARRAARGDRPALARAPRREQRAATPTSSRSSATSRPTASLVILAEGVLRTRFAEGYDRPRLREPDRTYEYTIDLVATSNAFLPGHRIRLLVTSSSFPRFDRNTNTGNPVGVDGPGDLREARQTIFHDESRASHLRLPIVER